MQSIINDALKNAELEKELNKPALMDRKMILSVNREL